jgi:hypothetical protein
MAKIEQVPATYCLLPALHAGLVPHRARRAVVRADKGGDLFCVRAEELVYQNVVSMHEHEYSYAPTKMKRMPGRDESVRVCRYDDMSG